MPHSIMTTHSNSNTLTPSTTSSPSLLLDNAPAANDSNGSVNGNSAASFQFSALRAKIDARTAVVGVMGMGYVGLPLIMAFSEQGFRTLGFDTNTKTITALQNGESHIGDVPGELISQMRENDQFRASSDFSQLSDCDVVIVCVPTPLKDTRDPDLSFVENATAQIAAQLHDGQLIILESTTYPGTTNEIVRPRLEATGRVAGQEFFLAFSPERIDPGNEKFPIRKVPKVVGGHTPACLELATQLYGTIVDQPVPVTSTQAAELTKLLENIFRSVNIALVNEMAMLCDRMGIDIWEVIDAAATKPYGFTRFSPGPGLGGHCIPIDPFYLSWKAREFNFQTNFIELAGEVNSAMPGYVVDKIMRALNDEGKALRGAKIGLLGMSYKANVGDCRESPSVRVAEMLHELGVDLSYNDPYVPTVTLFRKSDHEVPLNSSEVSELMDCDCVILLTDHRDYDYTQIAGQSRIVVDTRNAFKNTAASQARIVKL